MLSLFLNDLQKPSRPFLTFYLPKFVLVGIICVLMIALSTLQRCVFQERMPGMFYSAYFPSAPTLILDVVLWYC
jgi:hypothetical protein